MRQKTCAQPFVTATVWITRQTTVAGKYVTVETGDFRLNFSQTHAPTIGQRIELIGTIDKRSQCERSSQLSLIVQQYSVVEENVLSPFYIIHFPLSSFEVITNRYLQSTENEMYRYLPVEHVHILLGMTIGRKYSSQEGIALAMNVAGITHVLVASGANIVLLTTFIRAVMRKISSRRFIILTSLIIVFLYVVLVGNQAPILRAFYMFVVSSLAGLLGRKTAWIYPLLIGGGVLLIYQPLLLFSLSYWLTIAASAAISIDTGGEVAKKEKIIEHLFADVIGTFKSTFLVFLFTMPMLLYTIGQTTLLSLLSSVFLLWLVAPITIAGILVLAIGWCVPTLFHGLFYLFLWFPLEVFVRGVHLFSQFPFLRFSLTSPTVSGCILYYGILFLWCFFTIAGKHEER